MDAKIVDFSCFFEKRENVRNYLFYNRKRGSGHAKTHQKSIKNRCKIDAGKRHAKSMENDAKMKPKCEPKSIPNSKNKRKKAYQKRCQKMMPKKDRFWTGFRFSRGPAEGGEACLASSAGKTLPSFIHNA